MRNKSKLMIVMCVVMAVMSIAYAYFATNLDITATGNITTNWNVKFTSISEGSNGGTGGSNAITPTFTDTTATMSANLKVPGDYMEYDLVLKNSGGINAIIESIDANTTGSPAIIFSISGLNEGDRLARNDQKTMKIRIEYDPSVTSQPSDTTKTLTVSIKAVQDTGQTINPNAPSINQSTYLSSAILKDNIAQADTNIDFSQTSEATGTNGLYYTNTNTEGNQPTYYFRGDVQNNYIKFGKNSSGNDILWRIVRINEDGSIRIITQDSVGDSAFNTNYNDNAYVGYMYGTAGSSTYALTHSNTNSSTIKGVIDNWYLNDTNLSSYENSHLADAGFCNDRSIYSGSGFGTSATYYGAYNRLYINKSPQFACPNADNDLFTTSTSTKGNKVLTNPIGLITADEVWYAGVTTSTNTTHYLYMDAFYWTMSPAYEGFEWFVYSGDHLENYDPVVFEYGVRPVINLKSTVEVSTELPDGCTKLDGTEACPYIIKTN